MSVNLVKRLAQNSKKCNKLLTHVLYQDVIGTYRYHSTILASHKGLFSLELPAVRNRRCYCQEGGDDGPPARHQKLPPLMDFPLVAWPSVIKSLKNLILTTFIIKPYLDNEFNLPDFVQGSKKAVEVVSHRLSEGHSLEGLVTPDIIPNLQDKVAKMSLSQRELIPLSVEDIYFAFPYQIGIMFNQDSEIQKRFVEITMVYHVLRGLGQMRAQGEEPPLNMGMMPEYKDKISICNYRFIKEFTRGIDSDWTVNLLNHFRPIDEQS